MVQPALERILPLILALSGQGSKLAAARYLYRNSVIYDSNPPPRELFFCPIRMYCISRRNFRTVSRLSTTMFYTVIPADFYFTASSASTLLFLLADEFNCGMCLPLIRFSFSFLFFLFFSQYVLEIVSGYFQLQEHIKMITRSDRETGRN